MPLRTPTRRGSRWVPPPPGMSPSLISGWPNWVAGSSVQIREAAVNATSRPPPRHAPWMAATTGLSMFFERFSSRSSTRFPSWKSERMVASSFSVFSHRMCGTGNEVVRLCRTDHDGHDLGVALEPDDHRREVCEQFGRQRVHPLAPAIDEHGGDAVVRDVEVEVGDVELRGHLVPKL